MHVRTRFDFIVLHVAVKPADECFFFPSDLFPRVDFLAASFCTKCCVIKEELVLYLNGILRLEHFKGSFTDKL